MRGFTIFLGTSALLAGLALAPAAKAQVVVDIGVPPVCEFGYYEYPPYACAPYGFYGPGYFFNGIFLGVGPWAGWGYEHGWGEHRFHDGGGGRYHGRGGYEANHGHWAHGGGRPGGHPGAHPGGHPGGTIHGTTHGTTHTGGTSHGGSHGGAHR
ncbi:MAG: hypothetical protein ABSC47_07070 [Terracidiphilus sp.]|jgi:hypothetical protein